MQRVFSKAQEPALLFLGARDCFRPKAGQRPPVKKNRKRSEARRGSLFNDVIHLIQHKLQHIWALDCQLDMKLIKFPQANESNERCEEKKHSFTKKKPGKLRPEEIWKLEQSFLAKGNTKQQA